MPRHRAYADGELGIGDLAKLLERLVGFPASSFVIEQDPQSTFHAVYRVQGPEHFFLKIPYYDELKFSLGLEARLYSNFLSTVDLGVEVKAVNLEASHQAPFPFLLLKKADGVCLRTMEIDAPNFPSWVRACGSALRRIHEIKLPVIKGRGPIDARTFVETGELKASFARWEDYLFWKFDDHLELATRIKAIDSMEKEQFRKWFFEARTELASYEQPALLHGDVGSHNLFIDPHSSRVSAIIDWEDAMLGDPVFDLAMFTTFFRMDEFLQPLFQGYGLTPGQQIPAFLRKFWLLVARIILAKAVLRFKLGYDKVGSSRSTPKMKAALRQLSTIYVSH